MFLSLVIAGISMVDANEPLGEVIKLDGKVTSHINSSPRGKKIKQTPFLVNQSHMLRTYSDSMARILLSDGSKILVTEKASIDFRDERNIEVNGGQVFFSINKRDAAKSLNIITKTAVIGVKGTRFMVDVENDSATIHLDEGVVEVETVQQFKDKLMSDFEAFKQKRKREFKEYKKMMTMQAGETISVNVNGDVVTTDVQELNKWYKEFSEF